MNSLMASPTPMPLLTAGSPDFTNMQLGGFPSQQAFIPSAPQTAPFNSFSVPVLNPQPSQSAQSVGAAVTNNNLAN